MKKLLFLTFVIFFTGLDVFSQQSTIDSLQKRIETLEETLNKEYFVQVPKKDFQKTLETTVKDEIDSWVNNRRIALITLYGILSFILGFLLKYYFTENYRKQIDEKVSDETRTLNDKTSIFIKEMSERFNDYIESSNNKLSNLSYDISNKGAILDNRVEAIEKKVNDIQKEQNDYFSKTHALIENKINSTLSFIWDDIVDDNIRKAKERNYIGDDLIDSLNKLLESEDIKLSDRKKIDLVDALIRCYYYKKDIEAKSGDVMINVIEKYEKTLDLKPEIFANVAIKACNYYEYYGTPKFRDAVQVYCHKSINMLPDYGIPYTVLLELYMIDSKNSKNKEEKSLAEKNIFQTFKSIENNKSTILPIEIMERIKVDGPSYLKEYIGTMLNGYTAELNQIRERALHSLIKNYDLTMKGERDKAVLEYILTYGLNTNAVIIDGTWALAESVEAGKKVPKADLHETLVIKEAVFTLNPEEAPVNGIVYFLTGTDPLAMNLYYLAPFNAQKGIYKLEKDKLVFCFGKDDMRPGEFKSTEANGFGYRVYRRVL